MENEKTTKTVEKKLTPTEQNAKDIQDLKSNFDGLNSKLDQLLAALATKPAEPVETKETPVAAAPAKADKDETEEEYKLQPTDEISFVHLIQRAEGLSSYIKLPSWERNLRIAGEIMSLSRSQADEFVGKYRTWFNDGVVAVANDKASIAYAKLKKLKTAGSYVISKYNLDQIGDLSYEDLEDLVTKVAPAHRDNIIEYFKQKLYEGFNNPQAKDIRFFDLRKLEILNRLSGCDSLKYDIEEVKTRR